MKLGQKVLGKTLFGYLMKQSFYGQFVAGENRAAIKPTISRMHDFGVKSILDYSVEEDISEEQAEDKEKHSTVLVKDNIEDYDELATKGTYQDSIRRYKPHLSSPAKDRRYKLTGARTYFYENEATCEKNMETFLRCMEAVAGTHSTFQQTSFNHP